MFQLFKKRGFSDYVSDTFQFFSYNGKHFLGNYFIINGIFLLIMTVLSYFFFQVYFDFFLNTGINNDPNYMESYFSQNIAMIIVFFVFGFLFFLFISVLNYAYPVLYLKLLEQKKEATFTTRDIIKELKQNFFKVLLFFIGITLLILPILVALFAVLVFIMIKASSIGPAFILILLISIPVFLFLIPTFFCWIVLAFYEYVNNQRIGFFNAIGRGFKHVRSQYFPIVGSVMVLYIIIQVIMTIFSMIPYMFGAASLMTSPQVLDESGNQFSAIGVIMTIVMVFSILMSFILNNLLVINQGVVYYSRIEIDENKSVNDSIDLIGSE